MTKNTLLFLAAATTILTMGAGCASQQVAKNQTGSGDSPSATAVTSANDNGTDALAVTIESGGTLTASTHNYVAALAIYAKSGARIQFANCSGNPGALNIKQGVKFMIDNRDGVSHEIGIGTKTYTLGAYNYAVVSVPKAGSLNITCDGGGAAHVTVEK